jgi:5-methylcytosine-specific restriction endonuclease McrA
MANNWNIPAELEKEVRQRDKRCVYCGIKMKMHRNRKGTPGDKMTWEHIDNNEKNLADWNIALCCGSCNSSKGVKSLSAWLKSGFCQEKGINKKTVALIVKKFIRNK